MAREPLHVDGLESRTYDQASDWTARALVETCFRNSILENFHSGIYPDSATGDFSDVKVLTPYGDIPWLSISRISNMEMRALMIDVVNRTYTFLQHPAAFAKLGGAQFWDRADFDAKMLDHARKLEANAAIRT